MRDPWNVHINKVKRETWHDKSKEIKISDPDKINTHIINGSPLKREQAHPFFKALPGPTRSVMPVRPLPTFNVQKKVSDNRYNLLNDKNHNNIPDSFEKKYNKFYKRQK